MVVKNMDIWAISGNNKKKVAHHYIDSNGNHIITTVQVKKYNVNKLSLHLNTSIFDITKCIDEYK